MNAPTGSIYSAARFGDDTAHWLPRPVNSATDHIPGEDGLPLIRTTLAQLKDSRGFTRRMVATYGKVYRVHSFGGRSVTHDFLSGPL